MVLSSTSSSSRLSGPTARLPSEAFLNYFQMRADSKRSVWLTGLNRSSFHQQLLESKDFWTIVMISFSISPTLLEISNEVKNTFLSSFRRVGLGCEMKYTWSDGANTWGCFWWPGFESHSVCLHCTINNGKAQKSQCPIFGDLMESQVNRCTHLWILEHV